MDSLTQAALGAAVGSAMMGRKAGARATLWGAICGTVPDLDVFIPMGEAVADFTYHRSFSHSLLVLAALTPLFVWLILKFHPQTREWRGRWALTVYTVFATHVLLDSLTVYGTQIFWPLSEYPVSIGSVFIIDPSYTLPLLLGIIIALVLRHSPAGYRANLAGLALSTIYLAWGLGAQAHVGSLARASLTEQKLPYQRLLVQPTPFNSILWRVVAMNGNHYRIGYYSLMDSAPHIETERFETSVELLAELQSHWPVRRLQWFTHGFYSVQPAGGAVIMNDLRMGVEPYYAFRFKVADMNGSRPEPTISTRIPSPDQWHRLPALWNRIWDSNGSLSPGSEQKERMRP